MRARKLKVWSWNDYRYPMGLAAVLVSLCALIGTVGLFSANHSQNRVITNFSSDSTCRSGIATKVDVVLLDAFDFVLSMPPRDSDEAARRRAALLKEIADARAERAATSDVCNASATTAPAPALPPSPVAGTPEKASTTP
jgi:hypothetical protein